MDSNFKIENIDIPTIDFKITEKLDEGILELRTEIMGRIHIELAELKSKAIRKALIEMGWTPPK